MSTQAISAVPAPSPRTPDSPPTTPCSVVWCCGRPYVLEPAPGRSRWMGTDERGRPEALTSAELQRRGWSHRRAEQKTA